MSSREASDAFLSRCVLCGLVLAVFVTLARAW